MTELDIRNSLVAFIKEAYKNAENDGEDTSGWIHPEDMTMEELKETALNNGDEERDDT